MNLDLKKIYYYIIALVSAFILLWGVIDFASASVSFITGKHASLPPVPDKSYEPALDQYYQQRAAEDRLFDSLSRIIVSGMIFAYARYTINKLERS